MSRYKKLFLRVVLGVAFLIALLVGFGLLLPYLINLEPLKEKILNAASQRLNGNVNYQRLELSYFPQPHVKIHQIRFLIPEKGDGIAKSVEIYPEWVALLKGKLQVRTIHVESPNVNVRLSKKIDQIKEKAESNLLEKIKEVFASNSVIVPKMKVIVEDGRLNLYTESKSFFSFDDLSVRIASSPEKSRIEMACRSNLWENMKFDVALDPRSLKGHGHLDVKNFYLHALFQSLLANFPLNLRDASSDLRISFMTEGQGDLKATIEGFIPSLTLRTGENDMVIKGNRLKGTFWMKQSRMGADLKEWNLQDPHLQLSGRFQMDRTIHSIQVEIEGRNVDVVSTRRTISAMAGKSSGIQTIVGYVRGGTIPEVSLSLSGKSLSDLARAEKMILRGRVREGHLLVPISLFAEPLDLRKVRGEVAISKGILLAKNVEANWEDIHIQDVQVRIGLQGKNAPFHMEALIDTDLSQLNLLLRRFLKEQGVLQEIAQIKQLDGKAKWALVLGETMNAIKVRAWARDIRLVAHYGRIPFPLSIDEGDCSYDGKKISFQNLNGKIGRSTFSGLKAEVKLKKEPYLEIQSGECSLMLDELHSYASLGEALKKVLREVTSLKGVLHLSRMRMNGPLNRPKDWHFEMVGDWQGVSMDTHVVPGTLTSSRGKFRADPKTITFSDVEVHVLNASIHVSGMLSNYLDELERVELDIDGKVTPGEIRWLFDSLKVKREIPIRSSLSFSSTHLSWRRRGDTSFRGELKGDRGPKIYLDLVKKLGQIKVDPLILQDEASNCSIVLDLKNGALKVEFSGELSERTLDKIFSGYQFQNGRLKGDFRATLVIGRPIRSTVQGRLEADELSFPWQFQKPLEIEHISLRGEGSRISVGKARFSWGGMALALSGTGSFSEKGVLMDIDLSTDHVDLDQIAEYFQKEKNGKGAQGSPKFKVEGAVRFKANSFRYGRFNWEPLWANITIDPEGMEAKIEEAKLCGISTPGVVKLMGQELSFDIHPVFMGRESKQTLSCLLDHEIQMTGDLNLKGRIFARGQPQDLLHYLKGDLELRAEDGRIYYAAVLFRILEFINITEIYRGSLPNLKKEGLLYKLISLKGSFLNGKLIIREAALDGKTLEMVAKGELDLVKQQMKLTVLVAPLKTVDRIIKLIPLVREILGGTLVSIPLDVHGSLKDPKVTYLSPLAIGNELVEMMKRTLRLPFKLFEPIIPSKKEESHP